MKICVTLVGVCRPTLDSVIQNIERNQSYFRTMYLRHTFTFIVLTYKNAFFEKLLDYCTRQGIDCIGLDAVDEKDFIFPVKIKIPNIYRMFYSMNSVMNVIPKNTYDGILRTVNFYFKCDAPKIKIKIRASNYHTFDKPPPKGVDLIW